MKRLLEVNNLTAYFRTNGGLLKAVDGVSFNMDEGEVLAIVGESGSGKSVLAKTLIGLISESEGLTVSGIIKFEDKDLLSLNNKAMARLRAKDISVIFQDPFSSLNPLLTIGTQLKEAIIYNEKMGREQIYQQSVELLKMVGMTAPETLFKQYPHQLSGGMRQRVMIAMALACKPKLLIADEPTTALDVTVQAQIIELLISLKQRFKMSILLISHDLGVVSQIADKVMVMYAGKIIEKGDLQDIFYNYGHPYTRGLLKSLPQLEQEENKRFPFIDGQPPDLLCLPKGCHFFARCESAMNLCHESWPESFEVNANHQVSCWLLHPKAPNLKSLCNKEVAQY